MYTITTSENGSTTPFICPKCQKIGRCTYVGSRSIEGEGVRYIFRHECACGYEETFYEDQGVHPDVVRCPALHSGVEEHVIPYDVMLLQSAEKCIGCSGHNREMLTPSIEKVFCDCHGAEYFAYRVRCCCGVSSCLESTQEAAVRSWNQLGAWYHRKERLPM